MPHRNPTEGAPVAMIHVRGRATTHIFEAISCTEDSSSVTAVGRFRWKSGPATNPRVLYSEIRERTWPKWQVRVDWVAEARGTGR